MTQPLSHIRNWVQDVGLAWDTFWFAPRLAYTLAIMRMACGGMLAYIHLIWLSAVTDFFGPQAWISADVVRELHSRDWAWSWLWYVESPLWLAMHQLVAIAASLGMAVGCMTRLAVPLAWWMTLMVCHRLTGALFGLDQIVVMLAMYLMLSHCGSVLSIDAILRRRREAAGSLLSWLLPANVPSVSNNVATRLMQLHLCVIYLFGGLSKMRGEMWYDGSAMWYTAVNYEYQSLDITWLGHWRFAIAALTAMTIFWETFYCALVWPQLTRPIALGLAVFVHGGIALALGMVTFGAIMIVANLAFIAPETVRALWASKVKQASKLSPVG